MTSPRPIRVWDLPTRLFHWSLVLLVCFLWYSGGTTERLMEWHFRAGYAVMALVLFRILWGIWGSPWSRFSRFVASPRQGLAYAQQAWQQRRPPHAVSHNPLGGWMVLVLLAVLLLQTLTGLFSSDDISLFGPLSGLVSSSQSSTLTAIHHWNAELLWLLITLHILAIVAHKVLGEPLVLAMITGIKRSHDPRVPDLPYVSLWRAALLLALCGGMVAVIASSAAWI